MKRRELLDSEVFAAKAKELKEAGLYHIVGDNSIYVPKLNTSFINRQSCSEWPDLEGTVEWLTPGEIARMELERDFPDYHARVRKSDFRFLDISAPMYFNGTVVRGELFYYDLRGAFSQVYAPLSLDLAYPRGQGTMLLCDVARRLKPHKLARNTLVGMVRSHELTMWTGDKLVWQKYRNRWFNPALWYTIQAVLHDIADTARSLGSCYVATDSYTFTRPRQAGRFQKLLDEWGLEYRYITGEGVINSWGSWSIDGFKSTKRIAQEPSRIDNIIRRETAGGRWLSWWSRVRK